MSKLSKKWFSALILAGFLVPLAFCESHAQVGVPSYYLGHYQHAKAVLEQEYPDFLKALDTLEEEIAHLDSQNTHAQYEALMLFMPVAEQMTKIPSDSWEKDGVTWDLKKEVVVTYFVSYFYTRDAETTSVYDLLFDAFMVSLASGDAVGIRSEQDLMNKHAMSQEQAQYVRSLLHKLYPNSTLL